jgi:hypothetical protein
MHTTTRFASPSAARAHMLGFGSSSYTCAQCRLVGHGVRQREGTPRVRRAPPRAGRSPRRSRRGPRRRQPAAPAPAAQRGGSVEQCACSAARTSSGLAFSSSVSAVKRISVLNDVCVSASYLRCAAGRNAVGTPATHARHARHVRTRFRKRTAQPGDGRRSRRVSHGDAGASANKQVDCGRRRSAAL